MSDTFNLAAIRARITAALRPCAEDCDGVGDCPLAAVAQLCDRIEQLQAGVGDVHNIDEQRRRTWQALLDRARNAEAELEQLRVRLAAMERR